MHEMSPTHRRNRVICCLPICARSPHAGIEALLLVSLLTFACELTDICIGEETMIEGYGHVER